MVAADLDKLATVLDVKKYILQQYVPCKLPEQTLSLVFNGKNAADEQPQSGSEHLHGQQKCTQLSFPFISSASTVVNVKTANVLVPDDEVTDTKRVVELTLDTTAFGTLDYEPGDTLAIIPSNKPELVTGLLERLDLLPQADSHCHIVVASNCTKKSAKVPPHIPTKTTPRELLSDCLSLQAVPKKQFLSALAACTTDNEERTFLQCLSSKEGSNYYNELILEQGLTLSCLLEICATCKPTLALLVEHLPRLLPRSYSIANSPHECGVHELRIIYSVLKQKPGVTTSMLDSYVRQLHDNDESQPPQLVMYLRMHNNFRYTEYDTHSNQVLIGVGTSLAPFLGFLAHKRAARERHDVGATWLYAGARTATALPKHEYFQDMQTAGILNKFMTCYSRSQQRTNSCKYVGELLERDAESFVDFLLQPQTLLYVCADGAKISKSIETAVVNCLARVLCIDTTEAMQKLKDMRSIGKYREDLWL